MKVNFAHCLFEQSGTFRDEFIRLGIPAKDYDLCNDFGKTDWQGDLFAQIELAFINRGSIFDFFAADDIIIAFFPCTYFCEDNVLYFCGTNFNWKRLTKAEMLDKIMERAQLRNDYYMTLLKFCRVVEKKGLRAIIENPYNPHHFLRSNFPYRPAIIDMNRRLSGDYFKKPTQYLFVNCLPAGRKSVQMNKEKQFVKDYRGIDRSLISPDYAHNFICDHILGIDSGHTQPTLFNF